MTSPRVRTGPTVLKVRAASPAALALAVTRTAESLRRTSSGEHVLVVYEAGAARVYVEAERGEQRRRAAVGKTEVRA